MTTAAPAAVTAVEVLRQQAMIVDKVLQINLQGITHEESLIQPQPGGNCLNWVVGHLVCIYGQILPLLGQEPVRKEALERYDRGSAPIQAPAEALDLQELMSAWEETTKRFDAGLAGLTAEDLDKPSPISPSNDPDETVRSIVTTVLFHQAYHAGQTGVLRRLAGKEGAIR